MRSVLASLIFGASVLAAGAPPVDSTTNLYGIYVVGRGTQILFWRPPAEEYDGYRLYWWTLGGPTNSVVLPKTQRAVICGLAGAPVTYAMTTVLSGGLESVPSNTVAIPSEP